MVIGGFSSDRRSDLNRLNITAVFMKSFSSLETEIWNFVDESGAIVNPTLSFGQYSTGIGLYVVNVGFCKK